MIQEENGNHKTLPCPPPKSRPKRSVVQKSESDSHNHNRCSTCSDLFDTSHHLLSSPPRCPAFARLSASKYIPSDCIVKLLAVQESPRQPNRCLLTFTTTHTPRGIIRSQSPAYAIKASASSLPSPQSHLRFLPDHHSAI